MNLKDAALQAYHAKQEALAAEQREKETLAFRIIAEALLTRLVALDLVPDGTEVEEVRRNGWRLPCVWSGDDELGIAYDDRSKLYRVHLACANCRDAVEVGQAPPNLLANLATREWALEILGSVVARAPENPLCSACQPEND